MNVFQIKVKLSPTLSLSFKVGSSSRVCNLHPEGLASCPVDGTFIFRNRTTIPANSSEYDMFNFAESCKKLLFVFQRKTLGTLTNLNSYCFNVLHQFLDLHLLSHNYIIIYRVNPKLLERIVVWLQPDPWKLHDTQYIFKAPVFGKSVEQPNRAICRSHLWRNRNVYKYMQELLGR